MGCLQVGRSYFDFKNVEERDIRKWEKEIGSFSVEFNQVYQRLMVDLDSIHPSIVKRVIESEFSQDFYKIISENPFFKKTREETGEETLDVNKVVGLVFLLSAPGIVSNKFTYYCDKAFYVFLRSKANEEDDLSLALTKSEQLRLLISSFVEISCKGETGSFFKLKGLEEHGLIKELTNKQEEITNYIINDLFSIKNQKVDTLSFKELKDKFTNDAYYFSGGYFREKALECVAAQNAERK